MAFLHEGWLEALVAGGVGPEGEATEVVLAVGPERGPAAEPEVASGEAFPAWPSPEALEAVGAELSAALGAGAAGQKARGRRVRACDGGCARGQRDRSARLRAKLARAVSLVPPFVC